MIQKNCYYFLKGCIGIADRIAVIDDGRVTELGSHEELLRAKSRYAKLFELQASGYR
jgi:ATP-binding cassette, subfamily B, bacterial